jgi:hypothetical protein
MDPDEIREEELENEGADPVVGEEEEEEDDDITTEELGEKLPEGFSAVEEDEEEME